MIDNREDKLIAWMTDVLMDATARVIPADFIYHLLDTDFKCDCKVERDEWEDYSNVTYCEAYEKREAEFERREDQLFRARHNGMSREEFQAEQLRRIELAMLRKGPRLVEAEQKGLLP